MKEDKIEIKERIFLIFKLKIMNNLINKKMIMQTKKMKIIMELFKKNYNNKRCS